jgi:hypothetical protein
MRLAGQAQYRRSRLNSNVRPRNALRQSASMSSPVSNGKLKTLALRYRGTLLLLFLACWCTAAGYFMWRAKTARPSFIEGELAACAKKCHPRTFRLETTRTERAYQGGWRSPVPKYPECICE